MIHGKRLKLTALVLAVIIAVTPVASGGVFASGAETKSTTTTETTTQSEEEKRLEAQKKLEESMEMLNADLKASEEKLLQLGEQSKNTQEYIDTLDQKIGILNEQLTLLDTQITDYEEDIKVLQENIDANQQEADKLQGEVDKVQAVLDDLNNRFMAKYEAYCLRMRAVYISGNFNILTALLTCSDISSFLTRYEMVKAVSKSDAELLQEIQDQTDKILQQEQDLNAKKSSLDNVKMTLMSQQTELQHKQDSLTAAQEDMAAKKIILAQDKAESDQLFAQLTAETGMYTEFRNEDKELAELAEQQIQDLINGVISPDEVSEITTSDRNEKPTVIYNETDVYNKSDGVYNMTYPVPGHYTISAGFPNYSNGSYHGGIDFPCPTGSKVVAAQRGVVAGVQRLNYSYGYYVLIYHGTDADGKQVFTLYAHNSEILVSPGDSVYKGQQIAKSGSTGNSTGPHCHFEIRVGNTKINPTNYLSK